MAVEREADFSDNDEPDWTRVSVADPEPLNMQRIDEMTACSMWLKDPSRPGEFACKWGITPHGPEVASTAEWNFWISDPHVAFEFKIRFG